MADPQKVDFAELILHEEDKARFPLSLRKILYVDYVDPDVPYQKLQDPFNNGRLYSQHPTRKISLMIDYSVVAQTLKST